MPQDGYPFINNKGDSSTIDFLRPVATEIQYADSPSVDAFGRGRVSSPTTLFQSTFNYNVNGFLYEQIVNGAGSITHLPNESAAQLSTGGTTSGDFARLQSKEYIRYQPGKSQLIVMTGVLGAAKADVTQRIGYFDTDNGLFFEQDASNKKVVVRSSTSGSPVDTAVNQSSWNLDKLDGTGESGITLDLATDQIFLIDFQWLGTGRVRFGFVIGGKTIYCHEVNNANNLTTVYMTTPHLPVRAEIINTGTAASATTMKMFCASVTSEGGFQTDFANEFAIGRGTASLGVTTRRPVLSIRPRTTYNSITNRGHVHFKTLEVIASTNNCLWELVWNGTLTGASWNNVDTTYSIADYDTAATAITGGVVVDRGWALSGVGVSSSGISEGGISNLSVFNDAAGTNPDRLSIVCTSFTGTSNINALMKWEEQR